MDETSLPKPASRERRDPAGGAPAWNPRDPGLAISTYRQNASEYLGLYLDAQAAHRDGYKSNDAPAGLVTPPATLPAPTTSVRTSALLSYRHRLPPCWNSNIVTTTAVEWACKIAV